MSISKKVWSACGAAAMAAFLSSPASANFILQFDESGNGCLLNADHICITPDNGFTALDPTGSVSGDVLMFTLPEAVSLGSIGIGDLDGSLSDVLTFTTIGDLAAPTYVMIFYSADVGGGLLADSGLPPGDFTIGATETANGTFDWEPGGNSYLGISPENVPEPLTLSLFGAGLAGAVAMRRRKKKAA